MKNKGERRPHLYIVAWVTGIGFTLARGLNTDPWRVGVFDLDLISLLTGYLFLSVGSARTAVFALGQGFILGVFSAEPKGLSALSYLGVFWCIYLGSFYLNLHTVRGQGILISCAVLMRWVLYGIAMFFFYGDAYLTPSACLRAAVSIVGTGLIAPLLFAVADRLRGAPEEDEETVSLEGVKTRLERRPVILWRRKEVRSTKKEATREIPDNLQPGPRPPLAE